jgi:uncharacterized protein YbaA (DUF1428 family)
MAYVDGFVVPVPKDKVEEYRKIASACGAIWREFGALEYRECVADDAPVGEVTSFPRSVIMKDDETVIFSYITYESRAKRDEVNEKVMKDPRMKEMMDMSKMPFDGKRMIYGGFEVLVDL